MTRSHRASRPAGRVDVAVASDEVQLRRALPAWEAVVAADASAGLFQSPQMYCAWHAAHARALAPRVMLATIEGEPVGCLPLALSSEPRRGLRIATLASGNPRADLIAHPGHRERVAAAFADRLASEGGWDVLALDGMSSSSPLVAALLARLAPGRGYRAGVAPSAPAEAYLPADCTWQDYLERKGRHFRHSLKYQCKRIYRAGEVAFRRAGPGSDALAAFDAFVALEDKSWKASGGDRLAPGDRECLRNLARNADGKVACDVLFLELDGTPAAGLLSLRYRSVYYLFVTYYDERVRTFYPGRPLFQEALMYAFSQPEVAEVSFIGAYPYALSWCNAVREYRGLRIYSRGMRARYAETLDRWDRRAAAPREEAGA